MKNTFTFLFVALLTGLSSCKKDIYGCTDINAANYSSLATKSDGSCFYTTPSAKSTTVTISNWVWNTSSYVTTIPYSEITTDVIENGAVMTYVQGGTNVWDQLPLVTYNSGTYTTTMQVSITVGQVLISITNSDLSQPTEPSATVFKITVVS